MTDAARLLFPAVRWDDERGDWDAAATLPALAELGVGGYILFGGPVDAVLDLTTMLRSASPHPILVAADLERGAGQQFAGATRLPPAAALAALDDLRTTRRAGEVTGREAAALGVDWVYGPVADLDVEPANPIIGTRAFGSDPGAVARQVAAWIEGCGARAMTCAKHFPGHGRTTADSHSTLPSVGASASVLDADLVPFRAAMEAGVDAVMTAHVAYPALDPSGVPATLSRPILQGLLRERLGFDGIVVTDALVMEGVAGADEDEGGVAVRAVAAGCDALLYPADPPAVARALETARGSALPESRLSEALGRVRAAAGARGRRSLRPAGNVGRTADEAWSLELAARTVHPVRGAPAAPPSFDLLTVDDDLGGPWPTPSRSAFEATLRKAGRAVTPVDRARGTPLVVAVFADVRSHKGRPGLSGESMDRVRRAVDLVPASVVVLFGHPRLADSVPGDHVLCAWGGEPLMQEAAAVALVGGGG
ncbi:MAG: glycoside hydrolase family 3 N-terminal domain-containing protein [Longimicrobiales bacterium]|nr:glycoside hydrolase family 3 N-terminal domain-containing protein [Longimicrobiales bacterium]